MNIIVYSYNLHSGRNILFRNTLSKMIHHFMEDEAHILAFQEVQNNSKFGMHFTELKKNLNMHGFYGENLRISDGYYGNAIFSRFPIIRQENFRLPSNREPRGIQYIAVDVNGVCIHCYNTHLALGKKERNAQIDILHRLIDRSKGPTLLFGDFNTTTPPVFHSLQDLANVAGMGFRSTVKPLKRRIDYIFASHHMKLMEYKVIKLPFSDHFPIRAVLELR